MHPNYELSQKLIEYANKHGYNRDNDDMASEYWWETKQFLTHEFADHFWPEETEGNRIMHLRRIVALHDDNIPMNEQAKYLEEQLLDKQK